MRKGVKLDILINYVKNRDNDLTLTAKELKEIDLNGTDILRLKEKGYLERVERGQYIFVDRDNVINKKCEEEKSLEYYLLQCLKKDDFETISDLLESNYNYSSRMRRNEINLYIFLFSQIGELKPTLKDKWRELEKSEILIGSTPAFRRLVSDVIYMNMKKAQQVLITLKGLSEEQNNLLSSLMSRINDSIREVYANMGILIGEKNFDALSNMLREVNNKRKFTHVELYIWRLCWDYKLLKDKHIIPQIKESNSDSVFVLIDNNDFFRAIQFADKGSYIHRILTEICVLLEKEKNNVIENKSNKNNGTCENPLIKAAKVCLGLYMKEQKKSGFEELIDSLMKIDLLNHDESFSETLSVLKGLEDEDFSLDFSLYTKKFYEALENKNFDLAEAYIQVLENANKVFNKNLLLSGLSKILELKKAQQEFIKSVQDDKEEEIEIFELTGEKEVDSSMDTTDLINEIHNSLLKSKGLIIIDSSSIQNNYELELLSGLAKDMVIERVFMEGRNKIVFRYLEQDNHNFNSCLQAMIAAKKAKNYEKCLEIGLMMLRNFREVPTSVFINIALCYERLEDYKNALTYISLGDGYAHLRGEKVDFNAWKQTLKERIKSKIIYA